MIVAVVVVPLTFVSGFLAGFVFDPEQETIEVLGRSVEAVTARSTGVATLVALIAALTSFIIWAVLQAALVRAAARSSIGDPADVGASFRYGFARSGSVIFIAILVPLFVLGVMAVGALLAIPAAGLGSLVIVAGVVWAVYAGTMLSLSIPSLVVENRRGRGALRRSWDLVKGHFWHAIVVIFVAGLITGGITGLIGLIGGSNWIVRSVLQAIATVITAPFTALVTVLLYLDLRARVESLTSSGLRAELDRNPSRSG